jgi:hypothetical protein
MQSFQSNIDFNYNINNKLLHIIKNTYIKTFNINKEYILINIIYNKNNKSFNRQISIYYNKIKNIFTPQYILINSESSTKFDTFLGNIIETINNNIEAYERVEDIVYDINKSLFNFKYIDQELEEKEKHDEQVAKNRIDFIKKLEYYKIDIKNKNNSNNKLFSDISLIEMLGDQIIKIYNNDDYIVGITDLHNFSITIHNLNLENNTNSENINNINNINNMYITINFKLANDFVSNPPTIILTSNYTFKNNILNVIEKLKPFNDKAAWSIKYSIYDTVTNIKNIINKYGELDKQFDSVLDKDINDLEYLLSIKNENISENKLLYVFSFASGTKRLPPVIAVCSTTS